MKKTILLTVVLVSAISLSQNDVDAVSKKRKIKSVLKDLPIMPFALEQALIMTVRA